MSPELQPLVNAAIAGLLGALVTWIVSNLKNAGIRSETQTLISKREADLREYIVEQWKGQDSQLTAVKIQLASAETGQESFETQLIEARKIDSEHSTTLGELQALDKTHMREIEILKTSNAKLTSDLQTVTALIAAKDAALVAADIREKTLQNANATLTSELATLRTTQGGEIEALKGQVEQLKKQVEKIGSDKDLLQSKYDELVSRMTNTGPVEDWQKKFETLQANYEMMSRQTPLEIKLDEAADTVDGKTLTGTVEGSVTGKVS